MKHLEDKVEKKCFEIIQDDLSEIDENIKIYFNKNDCSIDIEDCNEKPINMTSLKEKFSEKYK